MHQPDDRRSIIRPTNNGVERPDILPEIFLKMVEPTHDLRHSRCLRPDGDSCHALAYRFHNRTELVALDHGIRCERMLAVINVYVATTNADPVDT